MKFFLLFKKSWQFSGLFFSSWIWAGVREIQLNGLFFFFFSIGKSNILFEKTWRKIHQVERGESNQRLDETPGGPKPKHLKGPSPNRPGPETKHPKGQSPKQLNGLLGCLLYQLRKERPMSWRSWAKLTRLDWSRFQIKRRAVWEILISNSRFFFFLYRNDWDIGPENTDSPLH